MPTAAPPRDLEAWRAQVPLLRTTIPLNHCSQAPQTLRARQAAQAYLRSWNRRGMDWEAWLAEVEAARGAFARLLGASPEEVAVTTSVSAATAGLASALEWRERSGVVLSGMEFPTVAHVWRAQERRGARIRTVPVAPDGGIPVEAYEGAVDETTRVVSACHAYYQNGAKQDIAALARLARSRGALLYVDAYQSLGTEPVDVKAWGADAVAGGCLKYLLGVPGIAFLYVRRELIPTLEPTVTGWFGRVDPFAFDAGALDWAASAARFETGTPPIPAAYIARAGLDVLEDVGLEAVASWTRALSARIVEGAAERGLRVHGPADPLARTPTTAILCPDAAGVETELRRRGVLASARGPALRLAPHFYNTGEEIDRALDLLAEVLRG